MYGDNSINTIFSPSCCLFRWCLLHGRLCCSWHFVVVAFVRVVLVVLVLAVIVFVVFVFIVDFYSGEYSNHNSSFSEEIFWRQSPLVFFVFLVVVFVWLSLCGCLCCDFFGCCRLCCAQQFSYTALAQFMLASWLNGNLLQPPHKRFNSAYHQSLFCICRKITSNILGLHTTFYCWSKVTMMFQ